MKADLMARVYDISSAAQATLALLKDADVDLAELPHVVQMLNLIDRQACALAGEIDCQTAPLSHNRV